MFNPKPVLSGLVDQFGRDFKAYLHAHPAEEAKFNLAWVRCDTDTLLEITQGFFEGLGDVDLDVFSNSGRMRRVYDGGHSVTGVKISVTRTVSVTGIPA